MEPDTRPALRISDADRESTVASLGEHHAVGRLTYDEFAERLDLAYEARTQEDLDRLTADLPSTAARAAAGERRRWLVSVMSGHDRVDEIAGAEYTVVDFMGGSDLDLRHATFPDGGVTINAFAVMGGSTIWVPDGARVELEGFALMGGNSNRATGARPDGPVIRVRAYSLMGGIDVKSGPRRRDARHRRGVLPPPPPPAPPPTP